jgi:hypothetical protein
MLERALSLAERLVTDAEVLQEICHRYAATERRKAIQPAFDALLGVVDDVFPIDREAAEAGKDIVLRYPMLSARDAVHAAVMDLRGVDRIMTSTGDSMPIRPSSGSTERAMLTLSCTASWPAAPPAASAALSMRDINPRK